MALQMVTGPTVEPITLEEAMAHLKADPAESGGLVSTLISMAREMCEQQTGRALAPQTWRKTLDDFPEAIRLDFPPIVSVTHVKYYDDDGVQQTLAGDSYQLDAETEPGWIVPAADYSWPTTQARANAVEVVYTCGYATPDAVPESLKQWMLLTMRATYDNPAGYANGQGLLMLPHVDRLLDRYTVMRSI